MAENWENGLPDEGRSPESGHRMAAEGMPFPWRGNGSTISIDLAVIWEMSDKLKGQLRGRGVSEPPRVQKTELRVSGLCY